MKAITLTQPWATLVELGIKRFETRSWRTSFRGPLAIHAAKSMPSYAADFFHELLDDGILRADQNLPMGSVICTVRLEDCFRTTTLPLGVELDPDERRYGDWSQGRYAWQLVGLHPFPHPVPAVGALGLWEWPE